MKDLEEVKEILEQDSRLIRLPSKGKAVFVGDTHGDFNATETIFSIYFKPEYKIVFLGDYVDRGDYSRKNIEFLFRKKIEAPEQVFLLAGNHEGYSIMPFYPADFWESLSIEEEKIFSEICQSLPFVAISENGLIAVHGLLPDVHDVDQIKDIQLGSEHWHQATWGDLMEMPGEYLGNLGGRPVYGEDYFKRTMKQLKKEVLIRSHQPHIKPIIFNKRCLTLMTSHAYRYIRQIAIIDLEKPIIKSVDELEIKEI